MAVFITLKTKSKPNEVGSILKANDGLAVRSFRQMAETELSKPGSELVELGGIEPPSESTLTQTSPGADGYFGLSPIFLAIAQSVTRLWLGSFIIHGASKAYRTHVLH